MAHEETVRIISGAKTAVLFIHGIAGTPDHFRRGILPLEDLVPEDFSVYNVLIEGHGKQVGDFSRSSMEKWITQVMGIFDSLCATHDRVVIAGHSMGTLFAVKMALERQEKVPLLFLIDCPLRVGVKPFGVVNMIRLSFGCLNPEDPVQAATGRVSSITHTWQVWKYIGWLPRLAELIRQMHLTAHSVSQLSVKCVAFQSKHDELVSCRSCDILRKSGKVEVHGLPNSTHFYYAPKDIQKVRCAFRKALEELRQ